MDELLLKVAVSATTFVGGKVGGAVTSLALRKAHAFVNEYLSQGTVDPQLVELYEDLKTKLGLLLPSAATLEGLALTARSTQLDAVVSEMRVLRQQLDDLSSPRDALDSKSKAKLKEDLERVSRRIDALIPLVSLVMSTQVLLQPAFRSPSALLGAASALARADERVRAALKARPADADAFVDATEPLRFSLYALFSASGSGPDAKFHWKEYFRVCKVRLQRQVPYVKTRGKSIVFRLHIEWDTDADNLVHDESELRAGTTVHFALDGLRGHYVTTSGQLLGLDSSDPVIVLKVSRAAMHKGPLDTPESVGGAAEKCEYLAFSTAPAIDLSDDTSDSGSDDYDDSDDGAPASPSKAVTTTRRSDGRALSKSLVAATTALTLEASSPFASRPIPLLNNVLRLAMLEERTQQPHTSATDEVLRQYLS